MTQLFFGSNMKTTFEDLSGVILLKWFDFKQKMTYITVCTHSNYFSFKCLNDSNHKWPMILIKTYSIYYCNLK